MKGQGPVDQLTRPVRLLQLLAITASVALTTCQAADELKADLAATSETKTAAAAPEQLRALRRQVGEVDAAYGAYTNAIENDQKDRLWEAYVQTNDSIIPKILEAVRLTPDSPMAFELLEW